MDALATRLRTSYAKPVNAFSRLFILGVSFLMAFPAMAQRETSDLLTGWKFIRQDVPLTAPTDTWETISIPHTWNATDGQGGPKAHPEFPYGYYRGPGWYEYSLNAKPEWKNKRVFIRFEAASTVAQVYLNGKLLGEHQGGFTAFCYELTSGLRFDAPNELRVRVDNTMREDVSPLTGDFNIDGGIYRPVQLIVTDPVCISPLDYASSGIYLTTTKLTEIEAVVEVKALVSNGSSSTVTVQLSANIISTGHDRIFLTVYHSLTLRPGETMPIIHVVHIANPHFWNGRKDPFLYTARF